MDTCDVKYDSALLDNTTNPVCIVGIDREFARLHKFYCPHCHNEMYATFGEVQTPHFRHNGDKCQYSKYLHDLAEYTFLEEYEKCLDNKLPFYLELRIPHPCNKACVLKQHLDCKDHYIQKTIDLTKVFTQVSLEKRVVIDGRYRRPDVLLESSDGKQLWVEIWVSHETEEDKHNDGRILEIKVDSEKDLKIIRQHKIVQSDGEDRAVRFFGIDANWADELFMDADDLPIGSYPCEQYFCFEAGSAGTKSGIIDHFKTSISPDLTYRIILRLNWNGRHDSACEQVVKRTTLDELHSVCLQRFYLDSDNEVLFLDESYNSLIVSEWRAERNKPETPHKVFPSSSSQSKPYSKAPIMPAATTADISAVEWIDLGLPSGTLWAKDDIDKKMSFVAALKAYGANLPSYTAVSELREHCTKVWDDKKNTIVFTGPNGCSISFPCRESCKSYWLNAYEKGDPDFGQCFHLGPDFFKINDKDAYSTICVRLVTHS